jgi:tRNA(fMet)-specific endonuclease VapC
MAIILDTDIIVESERGRFDLSKWLTSLPGEEFEIAAITAAELLHGVERASGVYRASRERFVRTVLETFPTLPYTERTAREHARIWADLESAGKMIGYYDLIVGATALERGRQLATFNKKHFSHIKGLSLIEPH